MPKRNSVQRKGPASLQGRQQALCSLPVVQEPQLGKRSQETGEWYGLSDSVDLLQLRGEMYH